MRKYILLIFSITSIAGYGQELPKVVPLSPEASSIFKFTESPVSLYSGTQNTSIPLLEVNSGGLTIPISLSYYSRGVQVSETASRVGIGWTLNYGGMISRQIRGIADEINHCNQVNNSSEAYFKNDTVRVSEAQYEVLCAQQGTYDYYPDKFMLNSNFYSGEFFMDINDSKIITQKYSDIKINSYLGAHGYKKFDVSDNIGNTYYFGGDNDFSPPYSNEYDYLASSVSVLFGGGVNFPEPNREVTFSSWNLKKIKTTTNEEIEYTYEDEAVSIYRRTGDVENIYSGNYNQNSAAVTSNYNLSISHQKVLKEINYKEGKIKFIKSTSERQDLAGGYALDRIEQYNLKNKLVRIIKFNYTYKIGFEDNNINYHIKQADTKATKRLFLESVVFLDSMSNEGQRYIFEYDEQLMPSRHSNSVDFWGYYNGKNRGEFLRFEDVAGNSSVDPIKMQAGILKKITYPTGGYSTFEYEPNILHNELPEEVKIQNPNILSSGSELLTFIEPNTYSFSNERYEKIINIPENIIGGCTIDLDVDGNYNYICKLESTQTNGPTYSFNSLTFNNIDILPGEYIIIFDPQVSQWNPYPIYNPDGTVDLTEDNPLFFKVSISWKSAQYNFSNVIYGPGNRIKKITHFSADDVEEYSKLYEYTLDSGNTSGYLLSVSNFKVHHPAFPLNSGAYMHTPNLPGSLFSSFVKDNFGYTQVNEYLTNNANQTNDKTSHFFSIIPDLGSYYKYPLHPVTDNEWLRGKELKTIFYKKENSLFKPIKEIENLYRLYNDEAKSIFHPTYPFINEIGYMPLNLGVDIETPLCINIPYPYTRDRVSFQYPFATLCSYYSETYSGCGNQEEQEDNLVNNLYLTNGYRASFFTGGTFDLHSTKVTEYFNNDETVETLTTYEYDYDNHYNVAKTTTVNSTGDSIETSYLYASNTNNLDLINKNMVGIPLITFVKKNGLVLSTQETIYKDWDESDDNNNMTFDDVLLAPEIILTSKGGAVLEKRIKYNKYDENGNPLEVEKENGMKICYIWGYNKTQPVAKIENISYDAIPSNLISNIQNATASTSTNSGSPESVVLDYLQALRDSVALTNTMITTLTYIPLVGVSTITDPKGQLTRYEYDNFNRLMRVSDAEGNPLTETEYHYRNQN